MRLARCPEFAAEIVASAAGAGNRPAGRYTQRARECAGDCDDKPDAARAITKRRVSRGFVLRLNVVPLTIPPLRERRPDILPLAEFFLRKYEPRIDEERFQLGAEFAAATGVA